MTSGRERCLTSRRLPEPGKSGALREGETLYLGTNLAAESRQTAEGTWVFLDLLPRTEISMQHSRPYEPELYVNLALSAIMIMTIILHKHNALISAWWRLCTAYWQPKGRFVVASAVTRTNKGKAIRGIG
jgi:hypothetical protein